MIRIFVILITLLLTSCGPVYRTTYHLEPPETQMGRMCANQCLDQKHRCIRDCNYYRSQCQSAEQLLQGTIMVLQSTNPEKDSATSRYPSHSSRCNEQHESCMEYCEADHRSCHTNCGGRVIKETKCTRNCE